MQAGGCKGCRGGTREAGRKGCKGIAREAEGKGCRRRGRSPSSKHASHTRVHKYTRPACMPRGGPSVSTDPFALQTLNTLSHARTHHALAHLLLLIRPVRAQCLCNPWPHTKVTMCCVPLQHTRASVPSAPLTHPSRPARYGPARPALAHGRAARMRPLRLRRHRARPRPWPWPFLSCRPCPLPALVRPSCDPRACSA